MLDTTCIQKQILNVPTDPGNIPSRYREETITFTFKWGGDGASVRAFQQRLNDVDERDEGQMFIVTMVPIAFITERQTIKTRQFGLT